MSELTGLLLKYVKSAQRNMYLYYPSCERHNPYLTFLVTVLREEPGRNSVVTLLNQGLRDFAEEKKLVLAFPDPTDAGWNSDLHSDRPNDLDALDACLQEVTKEDSEPLKTNDIGIPYLSEMLRQWHLMNSYRYMIGLGDGADMAISYAANRPENVAAILTFGGDLQPGAEKLAVGGPVTAVLSGASGNAEEYFRKANGCTECERFAKVSKYKNPINPASYVVTAPKSEFNINIVNKVYQETFSKVRKINTGAHGDMDPISDLSGSEFTWFRDDTRLDGVRHTWLTHVPSSLPKGEKVPLMIFCHGGSDNPSEAACMARFHELGRKEHFITVYPWGTNTASWDINYDEEGDTDRNEDELFLVHLIDYMVAEYPVDASRVYVSGFSNGAAMAQVIAMLYPEKIAGLCHIDSNWPGNRWKPTNIDLNKIIPMKRALDKKPAQMRMPVWYTYGTREASCPVYRGCTQQYQYDFWKTFNNIEVMPTQEVGCENPCESGVPGETVEVIRPNPIAPEQYYTVNRFYTRDEEPENFYNYCLMHDKGHEVAPMDPILGWNYVKQFRRMEDGSVGHVPT